MFRSIRGKFLGWLSIVLLLVIGGFGGSLYLLVRQSKLGEIDSDLAVTAQVLAENFRTRRPPPHNSRKKGGMPEPGDPEVREKYRFPPFHDDRKDDHRFESRGRGPGPRGGPSLDELAERLELPESLRRRLEDEGDTHDYAIWSPEGALLRASRPDPNIPRPELPQEEGSSATRQRGNLREYSLRGPRGTVVLAGKSIDREIAEVRRLLGYLLGAGGAVLAIGLVGGWFISKRALRPIGAISAAAEEISVSNLDRRIDLEATETELGGLARVLNSAFGRLQESIARQARFTADASHELRTPVSVILAQTSMARRKARSEEEYREVIEACHAAANRMKSLVDGLMTLARTDSGELQVRSSECDFRQLVDECSGLLEPLAVEKGIALRRDLAEATIEGDGELLVQLVLNFLQNAIRYNRPGGEVRIALRVEGSTAILSVSDTGIGIPAEDLPRIFDRFYRVDRARSSREGGTGLGLAIAKAIIEAHGGTLSCESTLSVGSTFTARLPMPESPKLPPPRLEPGDSGRKKSSGMKSPA